MTTWFDCEIADCLPNLKLSFYLSSYSKRKFLHKLDIARDFEMSNLIKKKISTSVYRNHKLKTKYDCKQGTKKYLAFAKLFDLFRCS